MAQEQSSEAMQVTRVFEQPEGVISFYSDFAQVLGTGHEVVLQFYETIPGAPGPGGQIQMVKTRLRATIVVSIPHAANIGNLLIKHGTVSPTAPQPEKKGESK